MKIKGKIKLCKGRAYFSGMELHYETLRNLVDSCQVGALLINSGTGELELDFGLGWSYVRTILRSGEEVTLYLCRNEAKTNIKCFKRLPVNDRLPVWRYFSESY